MDGDDGCVTCPVGALILSLPSGGAGRGDGRNLLAAPVMLLADEILHAPARVAWYPSPSITPLS
jgi:hypothetical protein